ncbi:30S ribosomal protein S24e [archaeon]|jgi:small subunit ribosomal protein S24e|nr:30S ribosomal protein S24e [archaeon]MDD2477617.1 30S ribosomal protein S24e [Candidatus ainarchaeum sp.]MDD3084288.1 30S ribosomal protein S24e [Candidatus ainarchaeum sp.]MDD4221029.1 30S ribosomal protein S24e [Candidatus ainarchaeum sp.]MDD4662501.1 30S ribosomal protein S24e [Candidatus ainarchaeum sp.]
MDIEIEKSRNELLCRTNVFAKIKSAKTVSRKDLVSKVSAMLGVDKSLVVVDKIAQNFGEKNASAYLKVYDDAKKLKEIELKYKIKRTGEIEEVIDSKKEKVIESKKEEVIKPENKE